MEFRRKRVKELVRRKRLKELVRRKRLKELVRRRRRLKRIVSSFLGGPSISS